MSGHIKDMVSQHWNTPFYIVTAVRAAFNGPIDLDPCDNEFSLTSPRISLRLPEHNGLTADWGELVRPLGGERSNVFCNPPFGRSADGTSIADWVKKCHDSWLDSSFITDIILLVPASTETTFWHEYIWNADAIAFLRSRVSFLLQGEEKAASTKGTAMVYWGIDRAGFSDAFSSLGKVIYL